MSYNPKSKHWTLEEFGASVKKRYPNHYGNLGDIEAANRMLKIHPVYNNYIIENTNSSQDNPQQIENQQQANINKYDYSDASKYAEYYDPGVVDHIHNALFGGANLISEIVSGSFGYGAAGLELMEDSKRKIAEKIGVSDLPPMSPIGAIDDIYKSLKGSKLKDGSDWDSTTAKFLHNTSAIWKKKSDEVFQDYVENSQSLHGYLEWQKTKPYNWDNFISDPIDMTLRGVSEMAPSIATMVGATFLGAPALLVGAVMEGSGEFNQAMETLKQKAEERGEEFNPADVSHTALASATAYGLISGWIERFQFNRIARVAGYGKDKLKRNIVSNLADKIDDSVKASVKKGGYKSAPITLGSKKAAAFGLRQADDIYAGVLEGVQEAMQATSQEMIGNIYDKYDGDFNQALRNAGKDLWQGSSPEQLEERWQSFWSGALGGYGLGKLGGMARMGTESAFNLTSRYVKDKETDTKIKQDIGEETGGTQGGIPVAPARSEKGVKAKAFIDPDSMNEEEVSNYDMQAERDGGKTPADLFVETVDDLINDPEMIERGEIGDYNREDVLYAIENSDLNDDSIIAPEKIEVLKQTLGETIIEEGVEEVKVDPVEKAEPIKPVTETSPVDEVVKPPSDDIVKPPVDSDSNVLQAKLDDVNKKLKTKVTGKLKTKLETQKAELEKSLGIKSKPVKQIEEKKVPEKKEIHPNILAERKKRQKQFIKTYKTKNLSELRTIAKANKIPNANKLNKDQIIKELSNKEASPLLEEVYDTKEYRKSLQEIINRDDKKITPLVSRQDVKVVEGEDTVGEKDKELVDPVKKVVGEQTTLDFQRPRKKGKKVIDNKEAADKIAKRLKKKFPWIEGKEVEKVFDEEGEEVAGRAFKAVAEWSKGKATLDTIPHEYGHLFIRIMGNHPLIKEGKKRFGGEEKLVQHMGEYYANKMTDKSLKSRFKTWLRKFRNALKNFFGMAMTDKQVADLISEKFYNYDMKEQDLYTLLEYDTTDFQKLIRQSKFVKTLNKAFDSSFNIALSKMDKGLMDINQYIDTMESSLPERYHEAFRNWLTSRKESDYLGFDSIAKKTKKFIDLDVLGNEEIALKYFTVEAAKESAQEFLDGEVALHEGEHDSRKDGESYALAVMKLFDVDIFKNEAYNLFEAARNKSYQAWRDNNFIPLLNSKGKLSKELVKDEEMRARRIYAVTSNQTRVNNGKKHNLINPIKVIRRGNKDKPKFSISPLNEVEKVYKSGAERGVDVQQPKYLTNWIAHALPHLKSMSRGMSVLTGGNSSMYFVQSENKMGEPKSGQFQEGYGFVDAEDLTNLQNSVELKDKVILFSRGDTTKILIADITFEHKQQAKNYRKFWGDAFKAGYITKEQGQAFMKITDPVQREREIANFSYTNALFPGYMAETYENVLKRIKIPLTPSYTSNEMPDMNTVYIDKEKINFKYEGKNVSGIENIKDVGNTYIGDGNTLTSRSLMKTISNIFGLNPSQGHHKSIIYDVDSVKNTDRSFKNKKDVNLLMIKHQHSVPESGLEIYDGNTLIGKVDNSGDIKAPDGTTIDMVMTNDEAKKVAGEYNKKNFTVKGSSFGLIKMTTKKKHKVKFPHQWLNHLFNTSLINQIKDKYAGPNSKSHRLISNIVDSTKSPESLVKLVNSLKQDSPDEISSALYDFVRRGLGFHPAASYGLETLAISKAMQPAFEMDNNKGKLLQMTPNYIKDLGKDEIAISIKDARIIAEQFKKATGETSVDIKTLNDWLAKSDVRVLAYRSPIPYIGGADYVKVKRVHNIDGTIQVNPETTFRQYEGDHDGDHMTIHFVDKSLDSTFKEFFKSKEYEDMKRGLDLQRFKSKKKADPTSIEDRFNMSQAMIKGQVSVGEVAKVQSIYGLLKQTFESINLAGVTVELNTGQADLSFMEKGYTDSVDHMLRIYIQAAVDNAKFLLLDKWNYTQQDLINKLFIIKDGPYAGKTLSDLLNSSNLEDIKAGKMLSKTIMNKLWNKYKKIIDVRNVGSYKDGKFDMDMIIKEGEAVEDFMNNRESEFRDFKTIFKKAETVLETLVSIPSRIFRDKTMADGSDNRISIMRYDSSSIFGSHIKAVNNLLPRLEEIKSKFKNQEAAFKQMSEVISMNAISLPATLKGRKMMPMIWETNDVLMNQRDKIAKFVESFKTEEKWEAFTIMYLDKIFDKDIRPTKFKSKSQIKMERLEKMLPLELLHSNTMNKYIKDFNSNLLRDVTKEDIRITGNQLQQQKGCSI